MIKTLATTEETKTKATKAELKAVQDKIVKQQTSGFKSLYRSKLLCQ